MRGMGQFTRLSGRASKGSRMVGTGWSSPVSYTVPTPRFAILQYTAITRVMQSKLRAPWLSPVMP
jgi:hypothetical protein